MPDEIPGRAIVIMAHPDEVEWFVGGTVAVWTDAGAEVSYILLTSGDKGSQDPGMTPERLIAIREAEQFEAAAQLGVHQIRFFREPDGDLTPSSDLRRRITAEVRRFRPDAVIIPDPIGYFDHPLDSHPDLWSAGVVCLDAILSAARNRMFYPELLAEGLEPFAVAHVWMASPVRPDRIVETTAVFERKLQALLCCRSQIPDRAQVETRLRAHDSAQDDQGRLIYREQFRYLHVL